MPVMVLYKDRSIPTDVAATICEKLGSLTKEILDGAIEVRVVDVLHSYNANEIHIEMRFRDFKDWTDQQLADYHAKVMDGIGKVLAEHKVECAYSFYIIPSTPPRSLWAQSKTKG